MFPKIGGKTPPQWMVKIMENPIKMDDLGGKPTIFGNTHVYSMYTCIIFNKIIGQDFKHAPKKQNLLMDPLISMS